MPDGECTRGDRRRKCPLTGTQPQSQGARGRAILDDAGDRVSVRIRDLVDPSYFGRDFTTGRTLNLFEVWLDNPRTDRRVCLGSMCRQGVYWAFDTMARVRVGEFDDVIITAEHDSCPAVSSGVIVMIGCCCGMHDNE